VFKNIEYASPLNLKDLLDYGAGQVVSKTLVQNNRHSLTLFSFDEGEEISTHKSEGDALILVLDGNARITIDNDEFVLSHNQTIVMPAKHPHAVFAITKMKMLLVVSFK